MIFIFCACSFFYELFAGGAASVHGEGGTGGECGFIAGKKQCGGGDFGGLPQPFESVGCDHPLHIFLWVSTAPLLSMQNENPQNSQ
jgi:hypothetical protein